MVAFNDGSVNLSYEKFKIVTTKDFNGLPVFKTG